MYGAMRPNLDDLITSYRCHGFAHVMGASVSGILCELVGKVPFLILPLFSINSINWNYIYILHA